MSIWRENGLRQEVPLWEHFTGLDGHSKCLGIWGQFTQSTVWHELHQWVAVSELGKDLPRQSPPSLSGLQWLEWKTKELTPEKRQQQGTATLWEAMGHLTLFWQERASFQHSRQEWGCHSSTNPGPNPSCLSFMWLWQAQLTPLFSRELRRQINFSTSLAPTWDYPTRKGHWWGM